MKNLLAITTLMLLSLACTETKKQYDSFGSKISEADAVNLTSLENLAAGDTANIKLTATVDQVCQMKGCWMTLKNEAGESVRVTFKDYGFFVPKDISGKGIILQGKAYQKTLRPEVAKHYADDAGEVYDSTKTYNEIAIIAEGVLVAKAD